MVSSTPAGSGLPIGLIPGALPSDHASRQTLNTTAMRLPFGHSQVGLFFIVGSAGKTACIQDCPHWSGSLITGRFAASSLEHDPEKWMPVFGKDHAQTIAF